MKQRPDRKSIRYEWINSVVVNPIYEEIQSDGRIKKWGKIKETSGKYLRVILLDDGETVHNVFSDRFFRG